MPLSLDVWPPEIIARHYADGWWDAGTMSERCRQNARERGAKIAYIDDGPNPVTYASMEEGVSTIAKALYSLGLERGEGVAVMLPDSAALHAAWLGAERSGHLVVAVPHRSGFRDIERLVVEADCKVFLSLGTLRDGSPAAEIADRLRQESGWEGIHLTLSQGADEWSVALDGKPVLAAEEPPVERGLTADELFMVIFTSGTTGRPKGVMQTMNRQKWMNSKCTHLHGDDIFLVAVPATGGFGLWFSHFTPPLKGATAIVRSEFSVEQTLEDIEKHQVTVLVVVPTQLKMLLAHPDFDRTDMSSVRILEIGGEPLPYRIAEEFERKTGAISTQFYGSSESFSIAGPTRAEHPKHLRYGTTGPIIPESEFTLLDEEGNSIPIPGRGRVASRGPGRSPGYFNDPAANEALVWRDGYVLLGDIVEVDAEGFVKVVGRASDFIIRGGLNISGPEVEDAVMLHPRVQNAAAVPMPDPIMGEKVCVYVVSADGEDVRLSEVQEVLAEHGYTKSKWPERIITVPELPIAPGGKVAKAELKADIISRLEAESKEGAI
ncbi:acyl--CoA ligase [Rhodococcus sp. 14C212]|uniref:class I adenylate-forming enzyme family protein n=1 Tax=Rhodococcus sp. 14C212 TaxID=2711209 RepID=UPI0013ED40E1|nr:class I adenylate-forming enzyme family protein [Rhodococcus sp. 14C212]NGP09490.1 acyl--CoA ligase [Rhodococcus sp. 14C212]